MLLPRFTITICCYFLLISGLFGQNVFVHENVPATLTSSELYPNLSAKSIMTPTAWGATGTFVFGGLAGTMPQPYRDYSDLLAAGGIGMGNAQRAISGVAMLNVNYVSKFSEFSAGAIISRQLWRGTSISAGALNLFAPATRNNAGPSYYLVISHAVQGLTPKSPYSSPLCFSLGAGSGRFYRKSPKDSATGKGQYGTGVFANISYEVLPRMNINAEWTGLNLAAGISWRPGYQFPALAIGVGDITGTSGNPRFIFSIAHAFRLNRKGS